MKKILIAIRDFNTGGVQKSLVNLLEQLKPEIESKKLAVDLLVLNANGNLKNDIPKDVNIIEANARFLPFGVTNSEAKKRGKKLYFKRSIQAVIAKFFGNAGLVKRALKREPVRTGYDIAISYSVSISPNLLYAGWTELVLNKIDAKEKWVYIHNDFVNSAINNSYVLKLMRGFDKILFVSNSCKENFDQNFPEFGGKTDCLYNFVNTDEVLTKARAEAELKGDNGFNIISVSRLSPEKAHIRTLHALKRLKDEGLEFAWHVLGDGPMRARIEEEIKMLGLADRVYLYGNQLNPHKFTKNASLFLLGSTDESFGIVLIDSMTLGVPVLSTNTISAEEVVGELGFICENTEDGIYDALKSILLNPESLSEKRERLAKYNYNSSTTKDKLISLLKLQED